MHRIIRNSQQTGNKSAAKNLPLKYRRKNNWYKSEFRQIKTMNARFKWNTWKTCINKFKCNGLIRFITNLFKTGANKLEQTLFSSNDSMNIWFFVS
jgi:hypothetical protein